MEQADCGAALVRLRFGGYGFDLVDTDKGQEDGVSRIIMLGSRELELYGEVRSARRRMPNQTKEKHRGHLAALPSRF